MNAESFGEVNFGKADLGDVRRTKRLVALVDLMVRRPGGTLPQKLPNPKDLRAFYRLMNCKKVTHAAILAPHRAATQARIDETAGPVLILHDATELDFTTHFSLDALGQIGNGNRRGYIVQNSLAVDAETRSVLGLYNQVLHRRDNVPKGETTAQKRKRDSRESRIWLQGTENLPGDKKLIDVCDQGSDTFEFLEHEMKSGRRFVIRSAHARAIFIGHDEPKSSSQSYLRDYARTLPEAGTWTLNVTSKTEYTKPKKKGKKQLVRRTARSAELAVSFAPIQIKMPKKKLGNHSNAPLPVWIVRVWEKDPPPGQERLEWFLLTNEPVVNFKVAYEVVGWYECRWIIEEFHKGKKTGCQVESPQFTTESRLQPAIALLSIVTLTLLNMRDASRRVDAKERKATEIISEDYVAVLSSWRHGADNQNWSIHDFYYALARLGGHQNRKSDHPPGWQTIWRGWHELQAMVCGYDTMKRQKKCG